MAGTKHIYDSDRIIELLEDGFLRADTDGYITMANKAIANMCGYASTEEMIGLHMKTLYAHAKDRDKMVSEIKSNGKLHNYQLALKRKDGSVFWSLSNIKTFTDDQGKVIGTEGLIRDITQIREKEEQLINVNKQLVGSEQELKAANQQLAANEQQLRAANQQLAANEQQLRASNQQLAANEQQLRAANQQLVANEYELLANKKRTEHYLDVAAEIIISLDNNGIITLLNKSGHELLGYKNDELIGLSWFDNCLPQNNIQEIRSVFNQIMQGQIEKVANYESDIKTKFGEIRTIRWHNTILENDNKEIIGLLSSGEDITNRIKAEEKFRLAMEATDDGIWDWDIKSGHIYYSPSWSKIIEEEHVTPVFSTWEQRIHPDDKQEALARVQEHVKGITDSFKMEHRLLVENNKYKWVYGQGKVVSRDNEGNALRMVGTMKDITERKQAEEKLKESEAKFRSYINHATVGVFLTDNKGKYIDVNPAATEITGYSREELLNLSIPDILQEKNNEVAFKNFNALVKKGSVKFEKGFLTKSGEKRFWEISAVKISDNQFLGLAIDTTERIKAEEALKISEENLKNTFNLSPSIIAKVNLVKGYFIEANQAVTRILGYTVGEFTSKPFMELIHPDDQEESTDEKNEQIKGKEVTFFENRYLCKDGSYKWIAWYGTKADKNGIVTAIGSDITERKMAEEELIKAKESAEQNKNELNVIFNTAADGMRVIGTDYKIKKANDTFLNLVGLSRDEVIGKKCYDIFSGEYCHAEDCPLIKLRDNDVARLETEMVKTRPDGKKISVIKTATSLKDELGHFIGIVEDFRDMSEYKLAEAKLKESEASLRDAQRIANIGNWLMDLNTGKVEMSDQMLDIIGLKDKSEASDVSKHEKLYTPESWQQFNDAFNTIVNKGQSVEKELELSNKNTKCRYVFSTGEPIFDDNNNVVAIKGTLQDITERKMAAKQLQDRNVYIETILANLPIGFAINTIDDGDVEFVNKQFEEIYGWSKNEFPNIRIFFEKVFPDLAYRKEMQEKIIADIQSNDLDRMKWNNLKVTTSKGEEKYVYAHNIPLFDQNMMISTVQDVTDRKMAQDKLVKAKENAEKADRLKSAFLANMSHEIRTPMTGLIGFSERLKKKNLTTEKRDHYIEIIQNSSHSLLNLINDIIDISKIEAGQLNIFNEPCMPGKILIDLLETFNIIKKQKNKNHITFQITIPDKHEYIEFSTDPNRIRQVLINLLGNALKFSDKGTIEFGYNVVGNTIKFFVKDEGIGIAQKDMESIFNRFEQASLQNERIHEGTGLGLSISKGIIELLGGEISVRSTLGKGTVFEFSVPYKNINESNMANNEDSEAATMNFKGITILVAEDDPINLDLYNETLKETEATVLLVENGKEAVEIVAANPNIDIILMDIRMPIMDGVEAAKIILKNNPKMKIVAQTAYAMANDRTKYLKMGFVDHFSKPIDFDALYILISKWIK